MTEYEIKCIVHNEREVITHVGFNGDKKPVEAVAEWITKGTHNFYTYKEGKRAEVRARKHPTSGRWYLTTNPDDLKENNLDFLPKCK